LVIHLLKAKESTSTMDVPRSPVSSDSSFDHGQRLSPIKWTSTDNEEEENEEEAFKALRRRERELKKKFDLKRQHQRELKKKNSSPDHQNRNKAKRSYERRSSNERDKEKRKRGERHSSEERMRGDEEKGGALSEKKKRLNHRLKSPRSRETSSESPKKRLTPETQALTCSTEVSPADAKERKRNQSISKFMEKSIDEKKDEGDEKKEEENQSSVFQTALRTLPNFLSAEDKNTIMFITHKRRSDPVTIFETMKNMLKQDEEKGRPLPSVVSSLIKRASAALKQGPPQTKTTNGDSSTKSDFVGGSVLNENIDRQVVMKSQEDNVQLNVRYLLGRNWEVRSGLIELTGVRNRGLNDREDLPVISIVRKPRDPTKHKNYSFNIPYKQVKNIHSILQGVLADFEQGEDITSRDLDKIKVEDMNTSDNEEELYDFNKLKMRGFKHKVYIAYPYEAQVCWFSYQKGKGGKKAEEGENVYEVLQLRKSIKMIEELNNKAHESKTKFFDIVIPTSNIHRLAIVFSNIHDKLGF